MPIVDFGRAAEQVNEVWGLLVDYQHHWTAARDMKRQWDRADTKQRRRLDPTAIGHENIEARNLRRDILRIQPLIEEIARDLDPTFDYRDELADLRSEQGYNERGQPASVSSALSGTPPNGGVSSAPLVRSLTPMGYTRGSGTLPRTSGTVATSKRLSTRPRPPSKSKRA